MSDLARLDRDRPHGTAQTYSDITFSDPNSIKRFLQRSRLTYAIKMARRARSPRVALD
jgi:hypothetical protein